jgi:hypothetical protein
MLNATIMKNHGIFTILFWVIMNCDSSLIAQDPKDGLSAEYKEYENAEKLLLKLSDYEARKNRAKILPNESQIQERIKSLNSEDSFPVTIAQLEKRLGASDSISFPSGSSGPLIATILWEYHVSNDVNKYIRYIIALNKEGTEAVVIKKLVLFKND